MSPDPIGSERIFIGRYKIYYLGHDNNTATDHLHLYGYWPPKNIDFLQFYDSYSYNTKYVSQSFAFSVYINIDYAKNLLLEKLQKWDQCVDCNIQSQYIFRRRWLFLHGNGIQTCAFQAPK